MVAKVNDFPKPLGLKEPHVFVYQKPSNVCTFVASKYVFLFGSLSIQLSMIDDETTNIPSLWYEEKNMIGFVMAAKISHIVNHALMEAQKYGFHYSNPKFKVLH